MIPATLQKRIAEALRGQSGSPGLSSTSPLPSIAESLPGAQDTTGRPAEPTWTVVPAAVCSPGIGLEALPAGSEVATPAGPAYRRLLAPVELPWAPEFLHPSSPPSPQEGQSDEGQNLLVVDCETTGLTSASPLFLVGVLFSKDARWCCEQYLARDYSEEAAVLHLLAHRLAQHSMVVTFNGRTFDLPFLRDRAAFHRVERLEGLAAMPHTDVLVRARARWSRIVENCKLTTLERLICRRIREDDIPSAEVPARYHEFVRTGDASLIAGVLDHNVADLVTTVELLFSLSAAAKDETSPELSSSGYDLRRCRP